MSGSTLIGTNGILPLSATNGLSALSRTDEFSALPGTNGVKIVVRSRLLVFGIGGYPSHAYLSSHANWISGLGGAHLTEPASHDNKENASSYLTEH